MKIYPVIHVETQEQGLEQSQVAAAAGADGVFLINHQVSVGTLIGTFNKITEAQPDLFVGINPLGLDPLEGYKKLQLLLNTEKISKLPNALWFDDATDGARTEESALTYLRQVKDYRGEYPSLLKVKLYGGVSFKYTNRYTDNPENSAIFAEKYAPFIDVVTTSGAGTGKPPSAEKIKAMKHAVGAGKLAIASGVSIDNISVYEGIVDDVLVASSLETGHYSGILVPQRVVDIVNTAHSI